MAAGGVHEYSNWKKNFKNAMNYARIAMKNAKNAMKFCTFLKLRKD
jgi:hypothetical protein